MVFYILILAKLDGGITFLDYRGLKSDILGVFQRTVFEAPKVIKQMIGTKPPEDLNGPRFSSLGLYPLVSYVWGVVFRTPNSSQCVPKIDFIFQDTSVS